MYIPIKKDGYDPFIDYLKGMSILFVVLTHCLVGKEYILFSLWGTQAVPLFLLIQVFHAYKKGVDNITLSYNLRKLFQRILKPFILLLAIEIILLAVYKQDWISVLKTAVLYGGIGPGSYYVWIYIQFFFLLPIAAKLICRMNEVSLFFLFACVCIGIEILSSYIQIHPILYRLLFIRYIFLIYLGYLWASKGIAINKITIILSVVSIIFILVFAYTDWDLEPLFANNEWRLFHWITYFYTAYLFVYLLYKLYQYMDERMKMFCCTLGKYSYEIFLFQMFVFTFFPSLDFLGNQFVEVTLRIVLTTALSIFPVLLYKKFVGNKTKKLNI